MNPNHLGQTYLHYEPTRFGAMVVLAFLLDRQLPLHCHDRIANLHGHHASKGYLQKSFGGPQSAVFSRFASVLLQKSNAPKSRRSYAVLTTREQGFDLSQTLPIWVRASK